MTQEHIWFRNDRDTWLTDLVFKCWQCDIFTEEAICPKCGRYLSASTNVVEALRHSDQLSKEIVNQIIGLARINGCLNAIIRESFLGMDDSFFDSSQDVSSVIYDLLDKGEISTQQAFSNTLLIQLSNQYKQVTKAWITGLKESIVEITNPHQNDQTITEFLRLEAGTLVTNLWHCATNGDAKRQYFHHSRPAPEGSGTIVVEEWVPVFQVLDGYADMWPVIRSRPEDLEKIINTLLENKELLKEYITTQIKRYNTQDGIYYRVTAEDVANGLAEILDESVALTALANLNKLDLILEDNLPEWISPSTWSFDINMAVSDSLKKLNKK
jgi:hypothetical protein